MGLVARHASANDGLGQSGGLTPLGVLQFLVLTIRVSRSHHISILDSAYNLFRVITTKVPRYSHS